MNSVSSQSFRCTVEGESKLPPKLGGEAGVCGSIADTVIPALQRAGIPPNSVAVTVRVKSASRISAVPSIDEQTLPEQHVGISDRPLNARAVQMLADAVARELANSNK